MLGHPSRTGLRRTLAVVTAVVLAVAAAPAALADPDAAVDHAYQAHGESIEGGGSIAQAAPITPGVHLDSFESGSALEAEEQGTVKFYRIEVEDGQRVHAAATIAAPPFPDGLPEESEPLEVTVGFLTAGGDDCNDSGTSDMGIPETGDGPITSSRVSETMGPEGCSGSELFLRVVRNGPRAMDSPLPMEIQVAVQPAGIGGGSPVVEEAIDDDGAAPIAPEDTEPISLGRSFSDATGIDPGSYVIELVPGEVGTVSIDVREGQRLRWRLEVLSAPEELPGEVALRVHNSVRGLVTVGGGTWPLDGSSAVQGGGMTAPVDLGNRGSDVSSISTAWLPGTHTVMLQRLQRPAGIGGSGHAPARLILTLELEGEPAEDGAEGTVLELGDVSPGTAGGMWSIGRIAMLVGAGVLAVAAVLMGVAGVLVLRLRRG